MQPQLFQFIALILLILGLVMLADKLRVAYPIVLVLGGLGLGLLGWFRQVTIEPDIIFLVFLPPLLYEAAWQISWKETWRLRRIIFSFAFPVVLLTAGLVAVVAHAFIPGFTLALGFLLGGLVSPPDAVSATAIMRRVSVPKQLLGLLEGESLFNDAASLLVVRFAQAAVLTGQFSLGAAGLGLLVTVGAGVGVGLAGGGLFYLLHRRLPTTPSIDIVLTLLTPYCLYYAAEQLHGSGVLAVVSGGLLLSSRRDALLSYRSRVEGINVWTVLSFVLNGLVFMLIGLELPELVQQLGRGGLRPAIGYGLLVAAVLVVGRLAFTYGAALVTRIASRFITVADPNPGWRLPLVAGWAGMRGVVSLAAALALPLLGSQGQAFPHRALLLFITFVVILVTLVGQGLTLPPLIRALRLPDLPGHVPLARQRLLVQQALAQRGLRQLGPAPAAPLNEYLEVLREQLRLREQHAATALAGTDEADELTANRYQDAHLALLHEQRACLHELNQQPGYDEEVIRQYQALLDVEEYQLRQRLATLAGEAAE